MNVASILFLRVSLGLLMLLWGIDKLVNVDHGVAVSERFYLDLFSSAAVLQASGVLQILLGLLLIVGAALRIAYPLLIIITGATLVGVWRSIIDPWGWVLEGSNVLFFPSLIIFAAALVLASRRQEDLLSVDHRRRRDAHNAAVAAQSSESA
jgi:putative oxidoreductase